MQFCRTSRAMKCAVMLVSLFCFLPARAHYQNPHTSVWAETESGRELNSAHQCILLCGIRQSKMAGAKKKERKKDRRKNVDSAVRLHENTESQTSHPSPICNGEELAEQPFLSTHGTYSLLGHEGTNTETEEDIDGYALVDNTRRNETGFVSRLKSLETRVLELITLVQTISQRLDYNTEQILRKIESINPEVAVSTIHAQESLVPDPEGSVHTYSVVKKSNCRSIP